MLCYCCRKGYSNKMLSASLIREPYSNWQYSKYSRVSGVRDVKQTKHYSRGLVLQYFPLLLHPIYIFLFIPCVTYSGLPGFRPWHLKERPRGVQTGRHSGCLPPRPIGSSPRSTPAYLSPWEKLHHEAITCERWGPAGRSHITNADTLHATGAQRWQQCGLSRHFLRTPKRRWPRRDQRWDESRGLPPTAAFKVLLLGPDPWRIWRIPTHAS